MRLLKEITEVVDISSIPAQIGLKPNGERLPLHVGGKVVRAITINCTCTTAASGGSAGVNIGGRVSDRAVPHATNVDYHPAYVSKVNANSVASTAALYENVDSHSGVYVHQNAAREAYGQGPYAGKYFEAFMTTTRTAGVYSVNIRLYG